MKTIVFLIGNLTNSGGTQRMLTLLCNMLIDEYKVIILVHQPGESFFELNKEVKVIELKKGLLKFNLQIYRILKESKAGFYINLDSNSVMLNGFLLPKKTKLIAWEHFSLENNYRKWLFTLSRMYAVKRAHKFILLSNFEVKLWNKKYNLNLSKAVVINNPITIDKEKITVKDNWSNKNVLAIGNDIHIKGLDILLKAWVDVDTSAKLTIVGLPDNQKEELIRLFKTYSLQNVEIKGRSANISEYYEQATLFVLSSRKEATPLVLIESQAFGTPIVYFDNLSSVYEMIGDSGLAVSALKKEHGLSKAINSILENKSQYEIYQGLSLKNSEYFSKDVFKTMWTNIFN